MLAPPLRDRGRQPAWDGDRAGAAILARTSVGAAFWKRQSRGPRMVLQHCWGRERRPLRATPALILVARRPVMSTPLVDLLDRRFEPHLDQPQQVPIADPAGERLEELGVGDFIEVTR